MKHTTRSRIKMIARNPTTRRVEEVFPEDEVPIEQMTPLFMGPDQRYHAVPGVTAAMVWDEWVRQNHPRPIPSTPSAEPKVSR